MKHTDEEYITLAMEDITTGKLSPRDYLNLQLRAQNLAYDADYADRRFKQACEVLIRTGLCSSNHDCANCKLFAAHERALSEIETNQRRAPQSRPFKKTSVVSTTEISGYKVVVKATDDASKIVIVMELKDENAV